MTDRAQEGNAWDAAMQALENGDIKEAERFLKHMAPNDVKMMLRRIAEKQRSANSYMGEKR